MKVLIVFKSDKSSTQTMNYLEVEAAEWCVTNSLLAITTPTGPVRYYPLQNIESFMEQT